MGDFINSDGTMTALADEEFEADAVEMGAPPEMIASVARELRLALNEAGGIHCDEQTGNQIYLAVARKYGLIDDELEPLHMRTQ